MVPRRYIVLLEGTATITNKSELKGRTRLLLDGNMPETTDDGEKLEVDTMPTMEMSPRCNNRRSVDAGVRMPRARGEIRPRYIV
jgi:hypothetical protein